MKITLDYDGPTFCDGCTMCDLENVGEVIFKNIDAPDVVENRPYICRNRRICENAIKLHADTVQYRTVGHWKPINNGAGLMCSECGRVRWVNRDYVSLVRPLYCEHCDSMMRVEVTE